MNISKEVAAATAVVGYDLCSNEPNARVPYARTIKAVGITGSTAAGDCYAELVVGNKSEGMFENTATGLAVTKDRDLKVQDIFVPANAQVQLLVRDAANTNPIRVVIEFGRPKSSGARSFGGTKYPRRSNSKVRRYKRYN